MTDEKSGHYLTMMGTGAGCGIPAFFCTCPACEEARFDKSAQRGNCGIMISGSERVLIDTPPDIRHQLNREGVSSVDRVIYTHAHFDHLGGLGELEYMMQLVTKERIPVEASQIALETIATEFHYMTYALDMQPVKEFASFEHDGVKYTPLPVTHAPGTFGYLIETERTRLFYASDTGRLPDETAEYVRGVDIAILDATYWGGNPYPQSHNSVQDAIDEAYELKAGTLYLTHLALHYVYPITLADLESHLERFNGRVRVGADGLTLRI